MKQLTFTSRAAIGGALALTLAALNPLSAQVVTGVGVGEVSGDDVSLILLGGAVHPGGLGWKPVASLTGYRVSFPATADENAEIWALTPAVGLRYRMSTGAVQAKVGYTFQSEDREEALGRVFGGGNSGVVTSAQADYWGDGRWGLQAIGALNLESEYLWSRGRAMRRVYGWDTGSALAGLDATWQGDIDGSDLNRYRAFQIGPVAQWVINPLGLIVIGGAGIKDDNTIRDETWYARLELVWSSSLRRRETVARD
ncbi:MAG: hypothetical protein HY561_09905 [Gemmatimonadetes bacterium]|nr:hypothetical protein [Gemmatimonadota bacterium]